MLYADIGANATGDGQVITDASSTIDVATTSGGQGYGGTIEVDALRGGATLAGRLLGTGGPGLGGRFKLDTRRCGRPDGALADILLAGGLTGAIDIHTRTGNLELAAGHTLKANAITLTADDTDLGSAAMQESQLGQVIIRGVAWMPPAMAAARSTAPGRPAERSRSTAPIRCSWRAAA